MTRICLDNITFSYKYFPSISGGLLKSNAGLKSQTALSGVSLEINHGDRVALLGTNGSGKSTLLKIVAGIYRPEQGVVTTVGRVYSFLGRNVGVMPQLSGYDNLTVRGLLMDLPDEEIEQKVQEIIEFTELGDDIHRPVSTYSMGMRARLTFGMLMFIEADIMLIDEGLGAGDQFFLEKARNFINGLLDNSKILLFANHSNQLLRQFCNKALLVDRGKVLAFGEFEPVLHQYNHLKK
ncbi:ABC transporter ATP-binding protein [Marinicella meishanensis]|uniref:ABC transporter ATP-binding protein n=1 Tax=Marinicella meishanensis TaxID=2873263 RepID=UPI001CBB9BB7|nr:ABC transporter ATP-binding protein [Marinicella sp. NBU2979]